MLPVMVGKGVAENVEAVKPNALSLLALGEGEFDWLLISLRDTAAETVELVLGEGESDALSLTLGELDTV